MQRFQVEYPTSHLSLLGMHMSLLCYTMPLKNNGQHYPCDERAVHNGKNGCKEYHNNSFSLFWLTVFSTAWYKWKYFVLVELDTYQILYSPLLELKRRKLFPIRFRSLGKIDHKRFLNSIHSGLFNRYLFFVVKLALHNHVSLLNLQATRIPSISQNWKIKSLLSIKPLVNKMLYWHYIVSWSHHILSYPTAKV